MYIKIGVVSGDYRVRSSNETYFEDAFNNLRAAALRHFPHIKHAGVVFEFEKGCPLFKCFKTFSNLHGFNWSCVDEVILSNYPAVIVPSANDRSRARRLKILSCRI